MNGHEAYVVNRAPAVEPDSNTGDAGSEFWAAFAQAFGEFGAAHKDSSNPHFKSKYADLASVMDAIRGPLAKHGLGMVQFACEAPEGSVCVRTVLGHSSGQFISSNFTMPVRDPKNPQAVGSALTYARRYAAMAICGIAPDDDDGNSAAKQGPSDKLAFGMGETLVALVDNVDALKALFTTVKGSPDMGDENKKRLLTSIRSKIERLNESNKEKKNG